MCFKCSWHCVPLLSICFCFSLLGFPVAYHLSFLLLFSVVSCCSSLEFLVPLCVVCVCVANHWNFFLQIIWVFCCKSLLFAYCHHGDCPLLILDIACCSSLSLPTVIMEIAHCSPWRLPIVHHGDCLLFIIEVAYCLSLRFYAVHHRNFFFLIIWVFCCRGSADSASELFVIS